MRKVNLLKIFEGADPQKIDVEYFSTISKVNRVFKEGKRNTKICKKIMKEWRKNEKSN